MKRKDADGNIDQTKLEPLMPWSKELPANSAFAAVGMIRNMTSNSSAFKIEPVKNNRKKRRNFSVSL